MKRFVFAGLLLTGLAASGFAQAQSAPAAKPSAKATKAPASPVSRREAIEVSTPLEENDPSDKLTAADLEMAKRVHTGEIKCELGAHVKVTPRRRAGYFLVSHGINRFVMHPVESKTGAIRLEDSVRGAMWLQLGNKSMLMSQKEGKRLADECASPEQADFAKNMTPVNLLEPAPPAAIAAPVAPAASAEPTPPNTPAAAEAGGPTTAPAAAAPPQAPAPAR